MVAQILAFKGTPDLEQSSPFECGFRPWENRRQAFSIQFFLVALIFLIFDIELVLIFPLVVTAGKSLPFLSLMVFIIFLMILTAGFIFEWLTSQLEWYYF